ncbi:hypothetical protein [Hoeflea sp.]|uniref:hypothetical protein n=1 Tax=Hoeflea sp. TaxID=1940281 RepID=UPI003B025D68
MNWSSFVREWSQKPANKELIANDTIRKILDAKVLKGSWVVTRRLLKWVHAWAGLSASMMIEGKDKDVHLRLDLARITAAELAT